MLIYVFFAAIVFLPPVLAWYWIDRLLRSIGMKYGRVTLLYILSDLALTIGQWESVFYKSYHTVTTSFEVILAMLASIELIYALLKQLSATSRQIEWLQGLVSSIIPVLSFILFLPIGIWADKQHWAETDLYALALATNIASICYNYRMTAKSHPGVNTVLILLSVLFMSVIFFCLSMSDFPLHF